MNYFTTSLLLLFITLFISCGGDDDDNTVEEPTNQSFIKYTQDNGQTLYMDMVGVSSTTNWENAQYFYVSGNNNAYFIPHDSYFFTHFIKFYLPSKEVGTHVVSQYVGLYVFPQFQTNGSGNIGYDHWLYSLQQNFNCNFTYTITESNAIAIKGTFTAYLRSAYNSSNLYPPDFMTVTNGSFEIYRDDITYEIY